jgi:hypothetical protein
MMYEGKRATTGWDIKTLYACFNDEVYGSVINNKNYDSLHVSDHL